MYGAAWEQSCAALHHCDDEHERWVEPAIASLTRLRACALMLGKRLEYLDLTLKLLSHRLRWAIPAGRRKCFALEALYMLTSLPEVGSSAREAIARLPSELSSAPDLFSPGFGKFAHQAPSDLTLPVHDDVDSSGFASYDPITTLGPESIEVHLSCSWRQLVSFSVTFPEATEAMGSTCTFTLRVISHVPVGLPLSRLDLRFNKEYIGTVTILDSSGLKPADRFHQVLTSSPSPHHGSHSHSHRRRRSQDHRAGHEHGHHRRRSSSPVGPAGLPSSPLSPSDGTSPPSTRLSSTRERTVLSVELDPSTKTASAPLLLQPDVPLDLKVSMALPSQDGVEVGDVLYATLLKLTLDIPPAPEGQPPPKDTWAKPVCLSLPSGVVYQEGLGVVRADVCEEGHDGIVASEPSTVQVPLCAAVSAPTDVR